MHGILTRDGFSVYDINLMAILMEKVQAGLDYASAMIGFTTPIPSIIHALDDEERAALQTFTKAELELSLDESHHE